MSRERCAKFVVGAGRRGDVSFRYGSGREPRDNCDDVEDALQLPPCSK